jgi:NAD-dependent dihydropyrimidine dehydrogenase PreA subunit
VDLSAFFEDQEIDVFSVVGIGDLPDDDQELVKDFFKDARSVVVFGKEVPAGVYRMPAKDKTRGMLRIAESLDRAARLLALRLNEEHIPARPVPLYLPVRISKGKVQGLVRLKHVAAAGGLGSIGMNTVLMSPRFGPRLLLSGVVTSRPVEEFPGIVRETGNETTAAGDDVGTGAGTRDVIGPGAGAIREMETRAGAEGKTSQRTGTGAAKEGLHGTGAMAASETSSTGGPVSRAARQIAIGTETGTAPEDSLHCTMCGKCAKICPGRAIGPEGVDVFRCRTIRAFVPPVLVPTVKWMLGRRMLLSIAAPLAPLVARVATIRCSLCVTECPNFEGAEGKKTTGQPPEISS